MKMLLSSLLSLTLVLTLTGGAFAQTSETQATRSGKTATTAATLKERVAQKAKERLAGAKLEACKRVEASLKNRVGKLSQAMVRHLNAFEKVQEKIENLAAKRTAEGKVIPNYDTLLATANAAKVKAQTAVNDVKDPPTFDCSSDNPKAAVTEFKGSFGETKNAFKAYHTALRNLLVAVASLTGQENRSATGSAKQATASGTR